MTDENGNGIANVEELTTSKIGLLEEHVEAHGEVHAIVSEHDEEIEIRQGTATFKDPANCVVIRENLKTHVIDVDEITRFYTPEEALH